MQTISSSTAVVNRVPIMEIKENINASPVRGSESSVYNYKSTKGHAPVSKEYSNLK